MRITRLHLDTDLRVGAELELNDRGAHHVARVLRMKPGAALQLFDGHGQEVLSRLLDVGRRRVVVRIESLIQHDVESPLRLFLGQGISRGERMDFTLQKSVELGVSAIVPLWTEHSQVQLDAARLAKRMDHWHGVVVSACEQSGRNILPTLLPPMSLQDWVGERAPGDLGLLMDPEQDQGLGALNTPAGAVRLLVGPEGGLSARECACARQAGFTGIRMGPRVLRTETAGLAALAALQTLWGDFR